MDEELNTVYKLAIDSMPKVNKTDSRKEQEQLRKSQRAWLKYKRENCNLIGGFKGGSNPWVSFFAADCERNEVKNRIEFLKKVASGTFKH